MKNSTSNIAILSLFVAAAALLASDSLQAALYEQSDISVTRKGRMLLERQQSDDSLARNDRVLLKNGSDTIVIFASEGRAIEQVIEEDLDQNGEAELLIQMDLGGSGGFKEFALLQSKDGKYLPIWEETGYCAGNASVEDRDGDGRPNLYIEHTNTEAKPPKEEVAVFTLENGELKPVE